MRILKDGHECERMVRGDRLACGFDREAKPLYVHFIY
jgi:hypothetical protein